MKKQRINVLHINSYYAESLFYKNLFDLQFKENLTFDVFVPVSKTYIHDKNKYGEYTLFSKNHRHYDRFIFHLKHKKILKDIKEKYNLKDYSVIHAHSLFSNGYIAMKLKSQYNIPYIVAVRNTDVNVFFKKMFHLRYLGVKILLEASQIIFLSESYRNQVIKEYIPLELKHVILKKTSILPNGVDKFWLENKNIPKKLNDQKNIRIIQVGDINENKNILTTVKAARLLIEKGYSVELNVVGRIKDLNIYNEIIKSEFVSYLGYQKKEDLLEIYRMNDIFILPSINETFGLVYAEAMSQGLPLIYTKNQGFDKQFEDNLIGYSVIALKEESIVSSIEKIVANYNSISRNCIEMVDKFDWKRIHQEYDNIYNSIYSSE